MVDNMPLFDFCSILHIIDQEGKEEKKEMDKEMAKSKQSSRGRG